MRFRREPKVDGLLPGERVLAAADWQAGSRVIATNWALLLDRGGEVERLDWERVSAGNWEDGALQLKYQTPQGVREQRVELPDPGELPGVVRERVTHTVVATRRRRLELAGRTTYVLLVARRSPRTDEVTWSIGFEDPRVAADPAWRSTADEALQELRSQMGL